MFQHLGPAVAAHSNPEVFRSPKTSPADLQSSCQRAHLNKSDLHGKLPGEIKTRLQHRMGLLKSRDLGRWINGLLVWPQPQLAFLKQRALRRTSQQPRSMAVEMFCCVVSPLRRCSHYQHTSKMRRTLDVLFDGCFQSCPVKHFVTLI